MRPNLDRVNRETWSSPEVVSTFVHRSGFLDAGEECLLRRVEPELRDQPLLDIGVGGGRTLPLLRELSEDYVGIDYSDKLVEAARRRFPQARIEIGDARDLSRFAERHFALVFFSFNGIDGITHDERAQVFREVLRVLRPGGLFAYSTNNLDTTDTDIWRHGASLLLRNPQRALHYAQGLPRALTIRRRLRKAQASGEGWTQLVLPNYGLSLVLHHISLANALREATLTGFETVEAFDIDGKALAATDTSQSPWFHMLARAPQTKGSLPGSSPREMQAAGISLSTWSRWTLGLRAGLGREPRARRGPGPGLRLSSEHVASDFPIAQSTMPSERPSHIAAREERRLPVRRTLKGCGRRTTDVAIRADSGLRRATGRGSSGSEHQ